eukprot:11247369-Alexandrium_andersonii.AAC.1
MRARPPPLRRRDSPLCVPRAPPPLLGWGLRRTRPSPPCVPRQPPPAPPSRHCSPPCWPVPLGR